MQLSMQFAEWAVKKNYMNEENEDNFSANDILIKLRLGKSTLYIVDCILPNFFCV